MFVFFLLAVLALGFVLLPAVLPSRRASLSESAQAQAAAESKSWYEQRMHELAEEDLDQAQKAELSDELAAVLLAEHPGLQREGEAAASSSELSVTQGERRRSSTILMVVGFLLIALAVAVYAQLGSFGVSKIQGAQAVLSLAADQDEAELQRWRMVLAAWLADEPTDAKSWYLLGHANLKLGSFDDAAESFAQAHQYVDNDLLVKLYWLQSRYLASQGLLDEQSGRLASEILEIDPNNQEVLEMLAVSAIRNGDAATAITLLNRTLNSLQDSQRIKATVDAIGALRASVDPATGGSAVRVQIASAEGVQVPEDRTVFVVARPIGGGMPFAVVRRPSWLLPFSVTLDDLVSMSPDRGLSQAQEFEVLVRLSATGLAQADPSDWRWISKPLTLTDAGETSQVLSAVLARPQ